MRKRRIIVFAATLLASGGAVLTAISPAGSAAQKGSNTKPPRHADVEPVDKAETVECFSPNLPDFARSAAERMGGVACATGQSSAASDYEQADWSGTYEGTIRGDRQLVRIVRLPGPPVFDGDSRYTFSTATPGCASIPLGTANWEGDRLVSEIPTGSIAEGTHGTYLCTQRFARAGDTLRVSYSGECEGVHGDRCAINAGTYRRFSSSGSKTQ